VLDLHPAADEVVRLLDGVTDDHLGGPTPNRGRSVAALLDHLMGLSVAFTWAARKTTPADAGGPTADGDELDPGWRDELPRRLRTLAEAWRDPAAWEGMTRAGGLDLPGEEAGVVALDELVLHGWDLARATGQSFSCDPESTQAVLEFTRETARPENAAAREGLFGPAVGVGEDATPLEQALGFAGRDPAWSPESERA
jgi:uncharacterized protein (TIGR03086 family)